MRNGVYLISMLLCLISSCKKEADNGFLPGFEQKLVISAFLSPSDRISFIQVTSNRPPYGLRDPYPSPGNISGWLSDGESEIQLHSTDSGFVFNRNEMQMTPGKSYYLRVLSDKGLKASAECSVPPNFSRAISADTSLKSDTWGNFYRVLTITISDNPDEEDYYRIFGNCTTYSHYYAVKVFKGVLRFDKDVFKDSDAVDGNIHLEAMSEFLMLDHADSSFAKIYLLKTEKSYYLYHKSVFDYKNDDENPFTEPTPVYSNINGGLGIFTSYTVDSVIFRLK